jgi:uncharacterized protein (TIGR01244 family)
LGPTRTLAVACVVATVLAVSTLQIGAAEAAKSPVSAAAGTAFAARTIGNFGQINEQYYRGEQPDREDYPILAALGIKTVIDLQADGDDRGRQLVSNAGMKYYRIPMTAYVVPTPDQITQFLGIVTDPAEVPVYVHCRAGKHRTGVMTAIYRMEHDGWNASQAFDEMKRYHYGLVLLHPQFKDFVDSYKPRGLALATRVLAKD